MLASRRSPTIALNLRGLPLSADTDQFSLSRSLHHLPICLRAIVTSGKTPSTVIQVHRRRFVAMLLLCSYATKANSRTIRSRVSQPASAGKEAD